MTWSERMGARLRIKSFRTKFILVVGAGVMLDLLLSGSVALWNVHRLGRDASVEIKHGLEKASNEYLENYIQTTALRANLLLSGVFSEVTTLAGSMQTLIDHPEVQGKIGDAVAQAPDFTPPLTYDQAGKWAQNEKGATSVLSVWGYLLGPDKQPLPAIRRDIQNTAIFDLMSGSLMSTGSRKLQMYYMGPKDRPIMRTTPYSDQAQTFDKLYPGHNDKNFWDFFFPGVYEGWQAWLHDPKIKHNDNLVTSTAPYTDAITGNLIVTFFHPLWNKERTDCAGAVAVDITLEQLADLVNNVRVADTGFGFLASSDGNVLAIKSQGEKTLGIQMQNDSATAGVTNMVRSLGKSAYPDVASMKLPADMKTSMQRIHLKAGAARAPYLVVLRRLPEINLWADGKIGSDHLTLGFVVPEREVYASLYSAESKMETATARIRNWQIAILIFSLAVVLSVVVGISKRITAGLIALAGAARRLERKDYSVRVEIPSGDEVGELGRAFNKMAEEIQSYTGNLEQLVEERTHKLGEANREIQALNEKLKGENVRMGAELDVARRIQSMVLPKPLELSSVSRLDIAGHMEAASEVGGDYYDVLQAGSRVKIGIGDVTGHGLESGVLMLMVQSAARALLESGDMDSCTFMKVLNNAIFKNVARTESANNLTLSFIDYSENKITLTGQHEEMIVVRKDGSVERIDTVDLGFPIGLEADISQFVNSRALPFDSEDIVILYTDGVTEAESPQGKLFGVESLCESANRHRAGTAQEIKQNIIRDVLAHIDTQKIHDDITLVVIKHL
ncbi:MAG: SpoIIE family protein phosphatase [Chthoniobacter sp.]|uniref:SpoIIE family protein phosphatase n=1 Tax=Chthoniobacter sp. TaxID=2510640 RepID=UPI0032A2C797